MSIQQLRQLFSMESQDTLQQMEDSILQLEKSPTDPDAIKRLFRSAHTIKGSAGVVGLEEVARFTHVMENLLDRVRNGSLVIDSELTKLLLACRDHISNLLDDGVDNADNPTPALQGISQELSARLHVYLDPAPALPPKEKPPAAPVDNAHTDSLITPTETATSAKTATLSTNNAEKVESDAGIVRLRQRFVEDSAYSIAQMLEFFPALEDSDNAAEAVIMGLETCQQLVNSAAAVEFMAVSEFAQMLVNVLKKFSSGVLPLPDARFAKLVLSCGNHLTDLINQSAERGTVFEEEVEQTRQNLLGQLRLYLENAAHRAQKINMPVHKPTQVTVDGNDESVIADNWHISLRFMEDALSNGIEPLASLRYLNTNGEIISLYTIFDTMPSAENMNPEACYLGFEIEYKSDANKEEIEAMFELVREHCLIHILPPHSKLSHYIQLIEELPENTLRLGEILISIGTLTERELEAGLLHQKKQRQIDHDTLEHERKIGEILVESGVVQQDVVEAALSKQRLNKEAKNKVQKTLNVDAEKLDQLINLVGELVIANASVNLLMQEVNHDRLKEASSLMSRLVEDIRNSTLRMRMVHIGGTFNRFRRLVHDVSRDLDKQIELVISGAEAELDKSMVEKINDPLMHLIRNAIDHGIEDPQTRLAQGKPASGTLILNAYHDSGSIVIEVSDDGHGLNREKILKAAIAKGLVKADQELSEEDIDHLIFEPNLSTSSSVTQLSGRGVGLDVVKRNINALNGMVDVHSEEGRGTTFQIFLPLTLAIIDGFLLGVGNSSFVVPLDRVVECVEFSDSHHAQADSGYLNLRGKVLPLLRMHQLFGIPKNANTRENIIVVRYGNQEVGLVVDELLGEFQAVIKPLGKIFEKLSGVSGATILGNGEVALILDIPGLVQKYAGSSSHEKHHRTYLEKSQASL
jgi:two-component system, chemotaxis family, sensor kinase CheA